MRHISVKGNYSSIIAIFIISFLINIIFIFQGIDLSDTGLHLIHQISATTNPIKIEDTMPMIFLTDFIGGLWLRFIDEPSLLWARIGGTLVTSLNAVIIFSILSGYFDYKKVFFVVLVSALFITTIPALNIIDYYTLPALIVNIELWIFNKLLLTDPRSIKSDVYSFILGFMFIPIILSKFTLILILIIIPICLILYIKFLEQKAMPPEKILATIFLGLISSIILFSFFYSYINILDSYIKYIFYSITDYISGKNPESIDSIRKGSFNRYALDYIYSVIGITIASIILYGMPIIKQRLSYRMIIALTPFFILITSFTIYALFIYKYIRAEFLAIILVDVIIGYIILISILYILTCDNNVYFNFLIIAGLIVMIVTPFGSATGIIKSIQGMWLILPLSVLCVDRIKNHSKNRKIKFVLPTSNIILATILMASIVFHVAYVYGDDLNRLNLDTTFSTPTLYGIYSTPEKAKAIDDLILHISKYSNKGDYVKLSQHISIFYYLTQTKPVTNPWIEGNVSFVNTMSRKDCPKLVVIPKVDTTNRYWPDENTIYNLNPLDIAKLDRDYVSQLNYSPIWENNAFIIYGSDGWSDKP